MPGQRAKNLKAYIAYVPEGEKLAFLESCYARGISGNEAIERLVQAVIKLHESGGDLSTVEVDLTSGSPETAEADGLFLAMRRTQQKAVALKQRHQKVRAAKNIWPTRSLVRRAADGKS